MHRFIATVAVMLVLGVAIGVARPVAEASPRGVAQTGCLEATLEERDDSGVQGSAQLCLDEAGVHATIAALELTAGDAYTVWFVYFDQAAACAGESCGPPDVQGYDPVGVVTRLDGLIAKDAGPTEFSGVFRDLRLSAGSELHLPVFAHGPASATDNRMLARQLLTPQNPALGMPAMGTVADGKVGHEVAVAIFTIPDGGI